MSSLKLELKWLASLSLSASLKPANLHVQMSFPVSNLLNLKRPVQLPIFCEDSDSPCACQPLPVHHFDVRALSNVFFFGFQPKDCCMYLNFHQKNEKLHCHLDNILPAGLAMLEDHLRVSDPQVPPHHRSPHLSTDAGILKKIHLNSEIRVWKKHFLDPIEL